MTAPRIIAGRFKGRRIAVPEEGDVRPTASRMREALFSRLAPDLPGARVLDLFAGSGALGLEALSRGAEFALLVEKDRKAIAAIRDNIGTFGIDTAARVIAGDARTVRLSGMGPFDIVFADPPYRSGFAAAALLNLLQSGQISETTIIVLELAAKEDLVVPAGLHIKDERRYGAGRIVLLGMEPSD